MGNAVRITLSCLLLLGVARAETQVNVCDASSGVCAPVTAADGLKVQATVSATANTVATATAAAGTCTEGQTDCPLSVDLNRNLRTLATSTSAATATAAAPSYGEGTAQPFSQDLAGWARTRSLHTTANNPLSLRLSDGTNFLSSLAVTGTFYQATQPVSGPLTDIQIRATALPTSDNHTSAASPLSCRLSDGTNFLVTDDAADNSAATATNALVLAGVVETSTTPPTSTDGYRAALALDSDRKTYVRTYDWDPLSANSGLSTATTLTELVAAPGAGVSIYVTDITFSSTVAATATTDQQMLLKRGTGTACGTGTAIVWGGFNQANSGAVVTRSQPLKIAANEALCWMHAAAGSKIVEVGYFLAP